MARYREFDTEETLRKIMDVFWELGYEGASMSRIEAATGLKKQSLYRAYGDKRSMYLASLQEYERKDIAEANKILRAGETGKAGINNLFWEIIDHVTKTGDRRGCLLCNASVDQAQLDEASQQLVEQLIRRFQSSVASCLVRDSPGLDEQGIRSKSNAVLAAYFGIRVLIKSGCDVEHLHEARENLITSLL